MTFRIRAALSSALVALLVAFPVCFFDPTWIPFSPGIPWDEIKDLGWRNFEEGEVNLTMPSATSRPEP